MQCFYCVLHALRRCQVTKLIPWECPHSPFLLCFTHFESMLGNRTDSLEVPTLYFYCVSHALGRCWVTQMMPWECPHSTFLLCFTRCASMPDNIIDSLGGPAFNVSVEFYML